MWVLKKKRSRLVYLLVVITTYTLAVSFANADSNDQAEASIKGTRGCKVEYRVYEPDSSPLSDKPTIILTHGFMRDLETMGGWGGELSAIGYRAVLVSSCNSSWINGRHEANAIDLITVRKHLEVGAVIYGGFSAGGLSAYLAALGDKASVGYIGLDAVDSGKLALDKPDQLSLPSLFVTAPPSICNADGNFEPIIVRSSDADSINLPEANHCSFEMPYDKRCAIICGKKATQEVENVQRKIVALVFSWLENTFPVVP